MDAIKVLIVEDELIIAESIKDLLEDFGYEVTDIVRSADEALKSLVNNLADIAILDIQLKGDKNGIWLGNQIKDSFDIPFIFLTSHGDPSTVKEAVATTPYGYIIKPVVGETIFATIETALAKYGSEVKRGVPTKSEQDDHFKKGAFISKNALYIKNEYLYMKIPFTELLYFKANGNYVEIHTKKKKVVLKHSLKEIAETLVDHPFFQTQRSYIVNLEHIDSIGSNHVSIDKVEIPLAKTSRDELIQKMQIL